MPDQKPGANQATAVYEVMTDTWGYDGPDGQRQFVRGDLVREGDAPYDFAWAETVGTLRKVERQVIESGSESTTQPLNPDGSIDEQAQQAAREGAGLPAKEPAKQPQASSTKQA